ncbi:hypothetical protein BD311DRAFT_779643 [Dichomitus squalens]|uniref:Uncharacterized protein n=1 Tax=Dichomitus squalens TaxID=114155 RepID=A0A4Q9MG39_9APHY|nr:hypothetical protein BD311DRAFT_779643 [Dichomitus squalens]
MPTHAVNGLLCVQWVESFCTQPILEDINAYISSLANATSFAYGFTGIQVTKPSFPGCGVIVGYPLALAHRLTIINRICAIVADTLLIILTWRSLGGGDVIRASSVLTGRGLIGVFLRNGTFLGILALNILILTILRQSELHNVTADIASNYVTPLSSILVSHFMLDLQEAYQKSNMVLDSDNPLNTLTSPNPGSRNFSPALGSFSAHFDNLGTNASYVERENAGEEAVDMTADPSTLGGAGPVST